jgi:MinD-like ATPase involved in chromosome partitioning or flagellar assembly
MDDTRVRSELTHAALVHGQDDEPDGGWRRALLRVSGGLLNAGPGRADLERRERMARIRRPLRAPHRVAIGSIKGGVGKTTVTACLGLALAEHRGDRVVALDANPDAGTLADRLTGEEVVTVRDLLRDLHRIGSWSELTHYTSLAGRLHVLASEQDPASGDAFSRAEYTDVTAVLAQFFDVLLTDSGTGLVHSAMEGTLQTADSIVVVGAPTVDGASRAAKTLDWMAAHGYGALVENAVVVLSCDRSSDVVDREAVREHFRARTRAVVEIPHDPHLAVGGRIELRRLRRPTREAVLDLAAHVADGFT